jgi:alpha-1,3-fucosyltransferase
MQVEERRWASQRADLGAEWRSLQYDYWDLRQRAQRRDPSGVSGYELHWRGPPTLRDALWTDESPMNGTVLYQPWSGSSGHVAHCCPEIEAHAMMACPGGPKITFASAMHPPLGWLEAQAAGFDAVVVVSNVRCHATKCKAVKRLLAPSELPPNALNVMRTMEPPAWNQYAEPTHRALFTNQFHLGMTFEGSAHNHARDSYPLLRDATLIYEPIRIPFEARSAPAPVVALVGNCGGAGTFRRHVLLGHLMRYVKIDSLGGCRHNTGDRRVEQKAERAGALERYKFVISVENSVCPDYVTEKAVRAYRYQLVPIVMELEGSGKGSDGSNSTRKVPGYSQFYPPGSYLNAADFRSIKALGEHINAVASDKVQWLRYMAHREPQQAAKRQREHMRAYVRANGMPVCRLARQAIEWARSGRRREPLPPMDRCITGVAAWPFEESRELPLEAPLPLYELRGVRQRQAQPRVRRGFTSWGYKCRGETQELSLLKRLARWRGGSHTKVDGGAVNTRVERGVCWQEMRHSDLTTPEDATRTLETRCQRRYQMLDEAMDACAKAPFCAGITKDFGLRQCRQGISSLPG